MRDSRLLVNTQETGATLGLHALGPPRAGCQAHRLEPCLNPRDRRVPRRRPGLLCFPRERGIEWKVGLDGRRTHLAIGFERSSLAGGAPQPASRTAHCGRSFPMGSAGVRCCRERLSQSCRQSCEPFLRAVPANRTATTVGHRPYLPDRSSSHRRSGDGVAMRVTVSGSSIVPSQRRKPSRAGNCVGDGRA